MNKGVSHMEVRAFLALVVPFIILFYLAVLLGTRPSKSALLASLLGGLVMGLVNLLVDIAAYYAHWWHYTINGLTLHVPLSFYITPVLVYGSIGYLLIWRFWHGRLHWLSLLFLIGIPAFCIVRDLGGGLSGSSYQVWQNPLAASIVTILMWVVAFYAGYLLFRRLAPARDQVQEAEPTKDKARKNGHVEAKMR
jgi:hypothetical protein